MVAPFDILRVLNDGASLWMEAAQTLEQGKARVPQLAATLPGSYVIFSQKTGNKILLTPDGDVSATKPQGIGGASQNPPDSLLVSSANNRSCCLRKCALFGNLTVTTGARRLKAVVSWR